MPIRTQLTAAVAGIALAAGVVLAWNWHGASRYDDGYRQAQADTQAAQAEIERGMQYERDRADAEYRGAVLARNAALDDLAGVRGRLDRLLRAAGRYPANPAAGRRPDGTGADWIGGFAACYGEYADLAADAAGWADRLNGLQGYVRGVLRGGDSGN